MKIEVVDRLETIPPSAWNGFAGVATHPFLRHEFLAGLERFDCVGERWGWLPHHLAAWEEGRLVGAVPLYLKYNSYGEFVFDWSWAEAYERANLAYYPKLVAAVPYTPASGPRLLLAPDAPAATADALVRYALEEARRLGVSSLHWLFSPDAELQRLETHGLLRRCGTQFHWFNRNYRDFDDFLETFTAEKRKKVKRERRRVAESGVEIRLLHGQEVTEQQWEVFHGLYASTFDKLGGYATLSADFFKWLGRSLPDKVLLTLASKDRRIVAAAFSMRSHDTLYGRHWGCCEEFHSLHFEACYYLGLEYCIREGLARFEPGAQGEHKVSRGFLPVATGSVHWIGDPVFRNAVGRYLLQEREAMDDYMRELAGHAPYKLQG